MSAVDLFWIPLGAGGQSVRFNGKAYEAICARLARRPPLDLYHSALVVTSPGGRYTIESAPVRGEDGLARGVVGEGPVGSRRLGRLAIFRYELRCWPGGIIPDVAWAVDSPRRLSDDPDTAGTIVELASAAPTPVWGRDELSTGEMWNSNSFVAWLLERAGVDAAAVEPPPGGRAPGWQAGVVVARRGSVSSTTAARPRAPAAPASVGGLRRSR